MHVCITDVVILLTRWNCLCPDGVVLVDSDYFGRESKKDRKGKNLMLYMVRGLRLTKFLF